MTMPSMPWLRWYQGTAFDPKFRLVARRSGQRIGDVVAVWAFLLEQAGGSADRGHPGSIDFETIDEALAMDEGAAQAIYTAMVDRGLIDADGRIVSWDKRQPKREREDATAADRKREERRRKAGAATPPDGESGDGGVTEGGAPGHADGNGVTPCHATSRHVTPRGEERREEITPPSPPEGGEVGVGFADVWAAYPRKTGEQPARREWAKLAPDAATAREILAAVQRQVLTTQWQREGGRYVPELQHWLRDERWRDTPPLRTSDDDGEPWWDGPATGVRAKGREIGEGDWDEMTEQWPTYRARVLRRAAELGLMPRDGHLQ